MYPPVGSESRRSTCLLSSPVPLQTNRIQQAAVMLVQLFERRRPGGLMEWEMEFLYVEFRKVAPDHIQGGIKTQQRIAHGHGEVTRLGKGRSGWHFKFQHLRQLI